MFITPPCHYYGISWTSQFIGATSFALGSGGFNLGIEMWTSTTDFVPGVSGVFTWEIGTSSTGVREFRTGTSLAGDEDLGVRASIEDVGDLGVRTSLEDVWMIGIGTPAADVEDLGVGTCIADVLRIGGAITLVGVDIFFYHHSFLCCQSRS